MPRQICPTLWTAFEQSHSSHIGAEGDIKQLGTSRLKREIWFIDAHFTDDLLFPVSFFFKPLAARKLSKTIINISTHLHSQTTGAATK